MRLVSAIYCSPTWRRTIDQQISVNIIIKELGMSFCAISRETQKVYVHTFGVVFLLHLFFLLSDENIVYILTLQSP